MLIFLQIAVIGFLTNKSNFRKNNSKAIGGKKKKKKNRIGKIRVRHPLAALPLNPHGCNTQTVSRTSDSIMMQRKRIKKSNFKNMRVRMGKNIKLQRLSSYLLMCEEQKSGIIHTCLIILHACISPEQCRCRCFLDLKVNGKSIKNSPDETCSNYA